MSLDLATADWLLAGHAHGALAEHAEATPSPALVGRLREQLGSPARAAAVIEQVELRRRGRAKFSAAERMLFTRQALEQATDQWIARYKAGRFAGRGRLVDACCGIGGDLAALGALSEAIGIDADPLLTRFAAANARVVGAYAATLCQRLDSANLPDCDAWHADPDRRPAGKRTTQPDLHEPSLETLAAWRERTPAAAIKLAPAARSPDAWAEACELEWISRAGECKQLVAWCGPLARHAGARVATRVVADGETASFAGAPDVRVEAAGTLGQWVHEPDPAVLAADLVGSLANKHGLEAVSSNIAYLTSDSPVSQPLLRSFRVREAMPLDRKRLAGWLAERGVGRLEIKCRGVDVRPERLRKELKPHGDGEATLLVFPDTRRRVQVVIAQRA